MADAAAYARWESVLARLWKQSRFSSYFYQSADLVESAQVPTLALSILDARTVIYYNPSFVADAGEDELIGLLVHEMLHVVHRHDHRALPGEDAALQNLAQDMVINSYIGEREYGFFSRADSLEERAPRLVLPEGLPRIPARFTAESGNADPAWEDVYRWLKGRQAGRRMEIHAGAAPSEDFDDSGMSVSGEHYSPDEASYLDADEKDLAEKGAESTSEGVIFKDRLGNELPTGMHLFHAERQRSGIEANMERVFGMARMDRVCDGERAFGEVETLVRRVRETDSTSWRSLIKSYVDFSSQSDEWYYSYARFNRRYFSGGIYAPGRIFREKQTITVAVDVSGSMAARPGELEAAFGVIEELMGKYTVHLVLVDENVFTPRREAEGFIPAGIGCAPYVYRKGDWRHIHTGKSGTTFFAPLFNDHMRRHREMLLVITDGYIYDLHMLKRYAPTLWVISGGRKEAFTPPFGRAVQIRLKGK